MDIIKAIKDGKAQFSFAEVVSEYNEYKLYISVFADALKIDGIRRSVTAVQMQQAADVLGCMLLTPKIVDLIWMQAKLQFDPIVNINGTIVANLTDEIVSKAIDKKIEKLGGIKDGEIVSSVGKYWVLANKLANWQDLKKYGKRSTCNYGWLSKTGLYKAITSGLKCWQPPGFAHNDEHVDPSQVIKLMSRNARLIEPNGSEKDIDMHYILTDPKLYKLASHEGPMHYLRQMSVPEPQAIILDDGTISIPEITIYGSTKM